MGYAVISSFMYVSLLHLKKFVREFCLKGSSEVAVQLCFHNVATMLCC